MKMKELEKLVFNALVHQLNILNNISGSDNPQIKELHNSVFGKVSALEDVLEAIKGDSVFLNILAGK